MRDLNSLSLTSLLAAEARDDARVYEVARLANGGDLLRAAEAAFALLGEGVNDPSLVAYCLAGDFAERGVSEIARIARYAAAYVTASAARDVRGARFGRVDTAFAWLFRTLVMHFDYHLTLRDATLRSWLSASNVEMERELREALDALRGAIGRASSKARCLSLLATLERRVTEDLKRHAPAEPEPPARTREPEPEPEAERLEALHAAEASDVEPRPGSALELEPSPALESLKRKLDGFALLVARGELARAAVVARDIEHEIENFDPVRYLPRLFSDYSEVLNRAGDRLTPFFEARDSLAQRALARSYLGDPDAFLGFDPERPP